MTTIQNQELSVELLDPNKDLDFFGTRYCTAGYIFQIEDMRRGPLLSGPTYPESFNTFDGQGIPDSFNHVPLRNQRQAGTDALVLGIGICDLEQDRVVEFARWDIRTERQSVEFITVHSYQRFEAELRRRITLEGRSVISETRLINRGAGHLPVSWFPHPFFPQPDHPELCALSIPHGMPDNPGYMMGANGFIRRRGKPEKGGHFQALPHSASTPLTVLQRHEKLGIVAGRTSYVPSCFPIWGNEATFSWEPYFERTAAAGETLRWSVEYHF